MAVHNYLLMYMMAGMLVVILFGTIDKNYLLKKLDRLNLRLCHCSMQLTLAVCKLDLDGTIQGPGVSMHHTKSIMIP